MSSLNLGWNSILSPAQAAYLSLNDFPTLFRRGSTENLYKRKGKPRVKVECENGSIFLADHVICTVPLGKTNIIRVQWEQKISGTLVVFVIF